MTPADLHSVVISPPADAGRTAGRPGATARTGAHPSPGRGEDWDSVTEKTIVWGSPPRTREDLRYAGARAANRGEGGTELGLTRLASRSGKSGKPADVARVSDEMARRRRADA